MVAERTTNSEEQEIRQHEQQMTTLGMWIYIASEIMLFGGLFTAYMIYRLNYADAFTEASQHLNVLLAGINTVVLLTSSLTMAISVHHASTQHRRQTIMMLLATALLGTIFLGIKGYEYFLEYQENLIPGLNFAYIGQEKMELFFVLYFIMTGLHAVHLIIGIVMVLGAAFLIDRIHIEQIEIIGLFWHFIDIVWVFIFPLLYLIDP